MNASDEKRKPGWKLVTVGALVCLGGIASCASTGGTGSAPVGGDATQKQGEPPSLAQSTGAKYRADAFFRSGGSLFMQAKLPEAAADLRKATEFDPNHAKAFGALGLTLSQWGNLGAGPDREARSAESEAAFRRSIELDPNNADVQGGYSLLLCAMGKPEEGLVFARRAIAINPMNPVCHYDLGQALQMLGRPEEAEVAFGRFKELGGDGMIDRATQLLEKQKENTPR